MMRTFFSTTFLLTLLTVAACAQDVPVTPKQQPPVGETKPQPTATPAQKLPPDPNKFALIIGGISGEETYAKNFSKWTASLRTALVERMGFAEDRVTVLTEKPSEKEQRASAENVRQALVVLRNTVKPDQQVFVFFIGHGSFDGKVAKFNLVGPDLSSTDYAQLFSNLPTRNVTVVNMASASGDFVKPLSANGRIVITATRSGMEQNATRFAEPFIAALGNPEADADKNGRVSVLEAFEYAVKLTNSYFEQKGVIVTEHALLDDNGDGKGHPKAEEGDGALAKTTYFDSLPQQQAGGDPVLAQLFSEKLRLEGAVEQLKARKTQMKEDEYEAELEKVLIELAKTSRTIRAKKQ